MDKHRPCSWSKIAGVHGFALLLALVLFAFHVFVTSMHAGEVVRHKAWLLGHWTRKTYRKIILLGCFLLLMLAHLAEAAARGLSALDAAHTKPYGRHLFHRRDDHDSGLRRHPAEVSWRHLGTLIAITGVLMFGCSTAFCRDLAGRLGASLLLGVLWKNPRN